MKTRVQRGSPSYEFSAATAIKLADFSRLTRAQRKQLSVVVERCYGAKSIEQGIAMAGAELTEGYDAWPWELCTAVDGSGGDSFDVWIVNVDTAVAFYRGTSNSAPVGMIQSGWSPTHNRTGDPAVDTPITELAGALDRAFRRRPRQ